MSKIDFSRNKILKVLILIFVVVTGGGRKGNFSVQNCKGGKAKIIIELGRESIDIVPEFANEIIDNRIIFELKHPNMKEVFRTNFKELEKGLPLDKLIIIRNGDSTFFIRGAEILPYMETDVLGEIACCPFAICI